MANRHSHKKLRAEVRARMASTGESHQAALQRIRTRRADPSADRPRTPDLIATNYFGVPITVAAYEILSHVRLILVSGLGAPMGLPWGSPSPLFVHSEGLQ